jgi:hypothetical protein
MNEPDIINNPQATFDLGLVLGQRRAFSTVSGRCSAAHVETLRRVRDEKLYRAVSSCWRDFCTEYLALSRRHADYLIALLNRFGPTYFELSQLLGLTPADYLAVEPAIREDQLVIDGQPISLIPANAPRLREAVEKLLGQSSRRTRTPKPTTLRARVADLAVRGRAIVNQLVDLYNASSSRDEREIILEIATELRVLLMQPGSE